MDAQNLSSIPIPLPHSPALSRPSYRRSSIAAEQPGYLGEQSLMSCSPQPAALETDLGDSFSETVTTAFLKVTGAASLPPQKMVEALAESYFHLLFYRMAVVDRSDLLTDNPSLLLSQALCLVGTLLRHPRGVSPLKSGEPFYIRAKTLLCINHEKDNLTVLKALCFVAVWNTTSAAVVNMDGPWHWLGAALRLLIQMGLHREATCLQMPNPGSARRVAWYFFVSRPSRIFRAMLIQDQTQDKIQAAYFGRPACLRARDFDVRLLQLDDFEVQNDEAQLYIEYIKLGSIMGRMVKLQECDAEAPDSVEEVRVVKKKKSTPTLLSFLNWRIRLADWLCGRLSPS